MSTELQPWQQRVVDEKRELDEKLSKLTEFFMTDAFDKLERFDRFLIREQAYTMRSYSLILGDRIDRFLPEPDL